MYRALLSCGLLLGIGCVTQRMLIPVMPSLIGPPKSPVVWEEPFQQLDPQRWREVEVHGHTQYRIVTLDGQPCLEARSQGHASILLSPVRFNPRIISWLSWEWRVDRPVEGEALKTKKGSDAPARVYVYFDTQGLPWQKRSLDYVWSAFLPVGTVIESAFSAQSKILVVESGTQALGQWRHEERNVAEDYRRAFGVNAPGAVAIGIMSDSDNTGGESLAYVRQLRVSRQSNDRAGRERTQP